MTDSLAAVWDEINHMKEELSVLKVRREMLTSHVSDLETLHIELEHSANKVELMIRQVSNALSSDPTP